MMNREEAIEVRSQQLQGGAVAPDQLAAALVVLSEPAPAVPRRRGRGKGVKNKAQGLLVSKVRHNRVLLKNLAPYLKKAKP